MEKTRSALDLIGEATAHFNARDFDSIRALLHPDVTWAPDPSWPEPGPYRGREAAMGFITDFIAPFASAQLVVDELVEVRGHGVARGRWVIEGASSGIAADVPFTFVISERDGLIDAYWAFFDHEQALASIP